MMTIEKAYAALAAVTKPGQYIYVTMDCSWFGEPKKFEDISVVFCVHAGGTIARHQLLETAVDMILREINGTLESVPVVANTMMQEAHGEVLELPPLEVQ